MAMGKSQSLADQIEGLEDDDRVEAALAELKSKVETNKEENNNE